MAAAPQTRPLGQSKLQVTRVAMGCWPIAGITSLGTSKSSSLAALKAGWDAGINFFDTAHVYGYDGESETLVGEALRAERTAVIATKGGRHWRDGTQVPDARPETLRRELEESLERLGRSQVELYYLHSPDPQVPIAESAAAIEEFRQSGLIQAAGFSNGSLQQTIEFHRVCRLDAVQPRYNMLQREAERDLIPWCQSQGVAVVAYWPLMKGLLAGHLARDHKFDPRDSRLKYEIFQGDQWERNQDLLDELRLIAAELGRSVAQLVLNWTTQRAGVTVALAGAKRPEQIRDNAGALAWQLNSAEVRTIDAAISRFLDLDETDASRNP